MYLQWHIYQKKYKNSDRSITSWIKSSPILDLLPVLMAPVDTLEESACILSTIAKPKSC